MKKILSAFVVTTILLCSQADGQVGRNTLGIGLEVGVPMSDLNRTQKLGIGGSAEFAHYVGAATALTLSAGYISFSGDEIGALKGPAINFIPIKAGIRYAIAPSIYLEPQLGYTSINTPNSGTTASGGFTYAAKAGFMINRSLDLSARYEGVSRKNSNINFLGLRLGYNFTL